MNSTQTKFEGRLDAAVKTVKGYEVVNDRQFANTGVLRVQPTDSFKTIVRIEYTFNDRYATLRINPDLGLAVGRIDDDGSTRAVLCNGVYTALDIVIDGVVAHLKGM